LVPLEMAACRRRMNGRDRCCAAQPEQQAPSAYTRRATSEMSLLIPNS
jgi:hypothetical protein